jgi:phosphonate transport system ATP-binding protein
MAPRLPGRIALPRNADALGRTGVNRTIPEQRRSSVSQRVTPTRPPALVIEALSKTFGGLYAVDNVSLGIPSSQFVGVIGRSGAGKSTLLRLLNRLTEPSGGCVSWNGTEVTALRGRKLRDWRRRCAMIFQQFNLVGRLDVMNNVLMGRLAYAPAWQSLAKLWSREDRLIAMAALDQFGLAELAAQRAESLSGGQQQRVAICRALVQEPEIVLADEPVASLDPENSRIVMEALRRINRHYGVTVVCNLHSLELARTYCDRLVGMAAGRVVFDDLPEMLTGAPARELYGTWEDRAPSASEPALVGSAAGIVPAI